MYLVLRNRDDYDDDGGDADYSDDDHGDIPERCRGPCMWVTGSQLPPAFAVESKE